MAFRRDRTGISAGESFGASASESFGTSASESFGTSAGRALVVARVRFTR
jgi:hypothetical protein